MEDLDQEQLWNHLNAMIGDYVASTSKKIDLTARQKALGHVQEVRGRIDESKFAPLTALYVVTTNTPTILGWKRYCLARQGESKEELSLLWEAGNYSAADLFK